MRPKPIDLKDWKKKAKKLKKKYPYYIALRKDCEKKIGEGYFALIDGSDELLRKSVNVDPMNIFEGDAVHDRIHTSRDVPMYLYSTNMSLVKVNTKVMIEELTKELKKYVSVEDLVRDALQDKPVPGLIEIYDRVIGRKKEKKPTSIKQKPGCLYLSIGGKPGAPAILGLRD